MANFIMKQSPRKLDPKFPASDPNWEKSIQHGKSRLKRIEGKFENEAQRRDYDRAVASNPNNVPGLPPVYPPDKIVVFMNGYQEERTERPVVYLRKCDNCNTKMSVAREEWLAKEFVCQVCSSPIHETIQ